jgi:hypothetical protein
VEHEVIGIAATRRWINDTDEDVDLVRDIGG